MNLKNERNYPRFREIFVEAYENLQDEAWWENFYIPMESRIAELRGKYAIDVEALEILDQHAGEPGMHRQYRE
jgi:hypothetical protein